MAIVYTTATTSQPSGNGIKTTFTLVITNNGSVAVSDIEVAFPAPASVPAIAWTTTVSSTGDIIGILGGVGNISNTLKMSAGATATYKMYGVIPTASGIAAVNTSPAVTDPTCGATNTVHRVKRHMTEQLSLPLEYVPYVIKWAGLGYPATSGGTPTDTAASNVGTAFTYNADGTFVVHKSGMYNFTFITVAVRTALDSVADTPNITYVQSLYVNTVKQAETLSVAPISVSSSTADEAYLGGEITYTGYLAANDRVWIEVSHTAYTSKPKVLGGYMYATYLGDGV
jgi:hypothetical protein